MIFASRARMPPLPLPCLIATARGFAVHDLHQLARFAEQVGTFLDGGAIRRGARARSRGFVVIVGRQPGLLLTR